MANGLTPISVSLRVRTKILEDRFNPDSFYPPNPSHHGTIDIKESNFLNEDHRQFDAGLFNVKPVEVHAVEPQQRLLMEVVYESLEASGLSVESLTGSQTGIYVGLMCADYVEHLNSDMNSLPTYRERANGDSDVAVAAGASLIVGPLQYVGASKLHMLSADSRSRMWDVDASEDCICCESQYLIEPATGLLGKTDKLLRAPLNDGSVPNIGLRSKALSNPIRALAVFESQEAQWPTMGEELIAGVKFQAVDGHSSGETAAAYAAGYITREDAVKIACYRGHFPSLSPSDRLRGMMAIGTTVDNASELCSLPMFQGRLDVAAINSSSSVINSGIATPSSRLRKFSTTRRSF
ncbi:thiolase-like protein [Usnea florida]